MAIPLRAKVFWTVLEKLDIQPVFQQSSERVRAASNRRAALTRVPGASVVTGGTRSGVEVEERTIKLDDGAEIDLRVYRPSGGTPAGTLATGGGGTDAEALPIVMNFHGGGFVAGDPVQSEWWASSVALKAHAVVVSPHYRLAPEHPYPVPVEDCYAATVWAAGHADELGADGTRLAVMGDSAGGNIAAVVSLMARDRKGPAIAAQVLVYPCVEFETKYPSEAENAHAFVLTKKDMDNVPSLYFAKGELGRQTEPYASPLRAESHADLPPALIQTAQQDPLRDQGPVYADALAAAGVPVRITNYVDAFHGFISMPGLVPAAHQALDEAVECLKQTL